MNKKILTAVIGVVVVAVLGGLVYYFQGGNLQGLIFKKGVTVTSPIKTETIRKELPAGAGKITKIIAPTFTSFLTEPIPQAWIDKKFNSDFTISFTPLITTDGIAPFSATQKNQLRDLTYRAIYVTTLFDFYFSSPLPWTNGKTYYEWLKNTIHEIVYFADYRSQSGWGGRIYLDGNQALSNIESGYLTTWGNRRSAMGLFSAFISIITHEARHNNGMLHTSCNNRDNMDENLRSMGAHGINALFLHWLKYKLPQSMVTDAVNQYGKPFLNPSVYVWRMCTFNENTWSLDPEDLNWVEEISGHPLPPVSF